MSGVYGFRSRASDEDALKVGFLKLIHSYFKMHLQLHLQCLQERKLRFCKQVYTTYL